MPNKIRVLIVDDMRHEEQSWKATFADHRSRLQGSGSELAYVFCESFDHAMGVIRGDSADFDCAVLDVRIPRIFGGQPSAELGNEVARHVIEQLGIPTVILSGYVEESSSQEQHILRLSRSGNSQNEVMAWIIERLNLFHMLRQLRMEKLQELRKRYFGKVWRQWETDLKSLTPDEQLAQARGLMGD